MREGCPVALPRLTSLPSDKQQKVVGTGAVATEDLMHLGLDLLPAASSARMNGGIDLMCQSVQCCTPPLLLCRRVASKGAVAHVVRCQWQVTNQIGGARSNS